MALPSGGSPRGATVVFLLGEATLFMVALAAPCAMQGRRADHQCGNNHRFADPELARVGAVESIARGLLTLVEDAVQGVTAYVLSVTA